MRKTKGGLLSRHVDGEGASLLAANGTRLLLHLVRADHTRAHVAATSEHDAGLRLLADAARFWGAK